MDAIKRAIHLAAQRLQENPAQEHIQFSSIGPPRTGVEDLDVSRSMSDARRSADLHQQRHSSFTPDMEPLNARYSRGYQSGVSESAWPGRAAKDGITFRILCPNEKIGGIIGKGGSIIAEMRRLTRANIRILGKDDLPKCASSDYELVQVFPVYSELQNNFFCVCFGYA